MNARTAIKQVVDEATDQELVAIFAALEHCDKQALGAYFSALVANLAKRIENKVGVPD